MSRIANIAVVAALVFACNARKDEAADQENAKRPEAQKSPMAERVSAVEEEMDDESGGYAEGKKVDSRRAKGGNKDMAPMAASAPSEPSPIQDGEAGALGAGPGAGGNAEQGPAPRAWFPETFLFSPLLVTDPSGAGEISVRVPDRLTNWRVLALAHSRNGSQAGATASFQGTLSAYVDPVVPSFLRAGDSVRVPIQLVNNTDEALQTSLKVEIEGGVLVSKPETVTIARRSSALRFAEIRAEQPGEIRLMARMGESDMVVRTIDVLPTGKPVTETQSGTLAAPRDFKVVGATASGSSKGRARLAVFPGALALLRSELGASIHRGGVAADAFAMMLAGRAPALLRSLGDEPDEEQLRKLTITSTQKVMKHARVLDIVSATLIAEAARSHVDNPVLERLGARAISTIEATQAPDGTCGGETGWTLQRLLVSTADCARAAHDAPNVTIRARGAFERNAKEISDPYTAAAILASGGATGSLRGDLQKRVLEAVVDQKNGAKILVVPSGVVRADGVRPGEIEATALAVLALRDMADAPLADLGATILASYAPGWGWGDGRTNLVCMEAALELFKDPLPERVAITLSKDGEVVAEGSLERDKVREVLNLGADAIEISGAHDWQVSAVPAVAGLGFSLSLTSWVPWTAEPSPGSELIIELPKKIEVGKAVLLPVQAIAPSGLAFEIELALPAGAQLDATSLDALVTSGALSRYEQTDGTVTMHVAPLAAAQKFSGLVRIIPTMAGSLQSGPSTIRVGTATAHLPPERWLVR